MTDRADGDRAPSTGDTPVLAGGVLVRGSATSDGSCDSSFLDLDRDDLWSARLCSLPWLLTKFAAMVGPGTTVGAGLAYPKALSPNAGEVHCECNAASCEGVRNPVSGEGADTADTGLGEYGKDGMPERVAE